MKKLINYLKDNLIPFSLREGNILSINEQSYELIHPQEGILFDEDFHLITEGTTADNYIFSFGGQYYSLPKGSEKKVKLNKLKYLGKAEQSFSIETFLGVKGPYEIGNGSGEYKDWCKKAKFLGVKTLGICEKNTLAGALKFQLACQKEEIEPIIGMEVSIYRQKDDLSYTIKCFAENERGWNNLLSLNKIINVDSLVRAVKEEELLNDCDLEGLAIVYDPKTILFEKLPKDLISTYYQLDTVEYKKNDKDRDYLLNLKSFVRSKMKPVAFCDAFYLDKEYSVAKQRLNSIGGVVSYESHNQYFKSSDQYIEELLSLFSKTEEGEESATKLLLKATNNLTKISDRCDFVIDVKQRHLPRYQMTKEQAKKFKTNTDFFWHLIGVGLKKHPELIKEYGEEVIYERIAKEADVIEFGDVIDYFLILWDVMQWAHKNDILTGIGRGSSGGCLIAFLLDLIKINALKYDLLFERFLSKERVGDLIEKKIVMIRDEKDIDLELDSSSKCCIFRENLKIEVYATELQEGDQIVSIDGKDC